jgi:adhesin transport system membrane fusion protein
MKNELEGLGLTAFQVVRPPRAMRKLAKALIVIFATLLPAFVLLPWVQNVQAQGRVIALDPLDRAVTIPAPVTGPLVRLDVQEGMYVRKGDVLAEMSDQDPQYSQRLQQQVEFARNKLDAAQRTVLVYETQIGLLEQARVQAIASANLAVASAVQAVEINERELEAFTAEQAQKQADFERKMKLLPSGVVSEKDFQEAEADFIKANNKVGGASAKVEQSRNDLESKSADVERIKAQQQSSIETARTNGEEARSKVAAAEKELNDAMIKFDRQKTQTVVAPRDGYVLRVHAANSADFLKQGDPLIELIPDTESLVVELWVRGIDAPLVQKGRQVRLQFEGWPAVQFAGWPSVAVGTFGGRVLFVDAQGGSDGRFRVLIEPDPADEAWPERRYLRQGVRANGWLLLDTVRLGYEVWRQLNAFPPTVLNGDETKPQTKKNGAKKSKQDGESEGK